MNQDFIINAIAEVVPAVIETGLLTSLATFQSPSQAFDSSGAFSGGYADVVGLVDILCTDPPWSDSRIVASEGRAESQITAMTWQHVWLAGYFPRTKDGWRGVDATLPGPWRIVVNGTACEIGGVEFDSQSTQTRVAVRTTKI